MFVLKGDNVQANPSENYILHKPYNISPNKEESDMKCGIQKDLRKIDESIDIKIFIASFKRDKH